MAARRKSSFKRKNRPLQCEKLENRIALAADIRFSAEWMQDSPWNQEDISLLDISQREDFLDNLSVGTNFPTKSDPLAKLIGGELYSLFQAAGKTVGPLASPAPLTEAIADVDERIDFRGNQVLVELISTEESELLTNEIEAGQSSIAVGESFGKVTVAAVHPMHLDQLLQLKNIQFAKPVYRPVTNIGSVDNEADVAMGSIVAKANFGLSGDGIKVGVLSDSYDMAPSNVDGGGAAAGIASGDLPGPGNPNGLTTPIDVVEDGPPPSNGQNGFIDEGRAMLELIHDIVPESELAFHTAFGGRPVFAQGIIDLANAGSDVIVDDIGYFDQPFFQDGIIAQAATIVAQAGIPFFSSAGNMERLSFADGWRTDGQQINIGNEGPYNLYDFDETGSVDVTQLMAVAPGAVTSISFQWDQPFASSGGASTQNDLDIFAFDAQTGQLVAAGIDSNVNGDAVEILRIPNPNQQPIVVNIVIGHYLPAGGPAPNVVKYISFQRNIQIGEYDTQSGTLVGHHQAPGAAGVGAADYRQTPAFGVNPPVLRDFSSAGGTPILFNTQGDRLQDPSLRAQPIITAPDNTNTTFFSNGFDADGDGNPNFPGTSAAAPHAAAVAALMLEAAGGPFSLSPLDIYTEMASTAIDMNESGFDFDSGFGLIDAVAAIAAVATGNNEAPTINVPNGAVSYTVGGPVARVGANGTIADADSANFDGGRLNVNIAQQARPEDRLRIGNIGNVSVANNQVSVGTVVVGTVSGGNGTTPLRVRFNDRATPARATQVLRAVVFSTGGANPSTARRRINFSVLDGDGGTSTADSRFVNVATGPSNQAPVVTVPDTTLTYRENANPIPVATNSQVTDADGGNFAGGQLRVRISQNAKPTDRIVIRNSGNVSLAGNRVSVSGQQIGTFAGGTGTTPLTVQLNNRANPGRTTALLRAIQFRSIGDNPSGQRRQIAFRVTDGDGGTSNEDRRFINVTRVNDAPEIRLANSNPRNYTVDANAINLLNNPTLIDPDSPNFATGRLTIAYAAGGNSTNRLLLTGNFSFSGNQVRHNNTVIGTRNSNGGIGNRSLNITFNSRATKGLVEGLLESIRFRTVNGTTGQRRLNIRLTDGDGGTSPLVVVRVNVNN